MANSVNEGMIIFSAISVNERRASSLDRVRSSEADRMNASLFFHRFSNDFRQELHINFSSNRSLFSSLRSSPALIVGVLVIFSQEESLDTSNGATTTTAAAARVRGPQSQSSPLLLVLCGELEFPRVEPPCRDVHPLCFHFACELFISLSSLVCRNWLAVQAKRRTGKA